MYLKNLPFHFTKVLNYNEFIKNIENPTLMDSPVY